VKKYRAFYAKNEVRFVIAGDVMQVVSSERISAWKDRQRDMKITQMCIGDT